MQPRESYTSVLFRGHLYSFGGCQLYQFCYNDVFIMNVNENCPNKCSSKGICKKEFGCACNIGYTEHDCSMRTKCKNDCSGNGSCNNNAKCGCYPGFTGPYCQVNLHCPKNCTSLDNGHCSQKGTCICKEGYGGADCSKITSCDVLYVPTNFNISDLNISSLKNFTTFEININKNTTFSNKTNIERPSNIKQRLMKFELKLQNISNYSLSNCGKITNKTDKITKTNKKNNLTNRKKNYINNEMISKNLDFNSKIPIFLQTQPLVKSKL